MNIFMKAISQKIRSHEKYVFYNRPIFIIPHIEIVLTGDYFKFTSSLICTSRYFINYNFFLDLSQIITEFW